MNFLRALCLIGLGLLPGTQAHGQMCSEYMKCGIGYRCVKMTPGTITGLCTRIPGFVTEPKEKEVLVSCHTVDTQEACMKLDHCNWPYRTNACVTACETRKEREECEKPGLCFWVARTGGCISMQQFEKKEQFNKKEQFKK